MENVEGSTRHLAWEACFNVRDLGGYPIQDGEQTRWRAIVRADSLCRLTPAGCEALVSYGVRTIIDLRHAHELEEAPHPFAHLTAPESTPRYWHLPLEEWGEPAYLAALRAITSRDEMYIPALIHFPGRVAAIMRAIAAAPEGGVLIHCHAGKDRTGIIIAMLLALAGVATATIVEDYALSDVYLRPRYEELLQQATDEEERAALAVLRKAPPGRMLTLLAWLEREHGGVRSYLLAAGLAEPEIERLRSRLRD